MNDFGAAGAAGDQVESLLIDVRASTQGFAEDVAAMRGTFDTTLVDGFARAGTVLERGLLGAIRRGSLGFDDLKRIAFGVIDEIAAQALHGLFSGGGLGGGSGGIGGLLNFGNLLGSILGLPGLANGGLVAPGRGYLVGERGPELFVPASAGRIVPDPAPPLRAALSAPAISGLPGRATGGPVSPERPYLVGERGPELFVPASAGTVVPNPPQASALEVRVSINVVSPRGADPAQSLQRSSRQVASAVRRALQQF